MHKIKWGALIVMAGLVGVIVLTNPPQRDAARATTSAAADMTANSSTDTVTAQADLEDAYKRGWKEAQDAIARASEVAGQKARDGAFADGQKKGYDEGYQAGQTEGHTEGLTTGLQQGAVAGYAQGHQHGFTEGHVKGFEEGYQHGLQAGRDGN